MSWLRTPRQRIRRQTTRVTACPERSFQSEECLKTIAVSRAWSDHKFNVGLARPVHHRRTRKLLEQYRFLRELCVKLSEVERTCRVPTSLAALSAAAASNIGAVMAGWAGGGRASGAMLQGEVDKTVSLDGTRMAEAPQNVILSRRAGFAKAPFQKGGSCGPHEVGILRVYAGST